MSTRAVKIVVLAGSLIALAFGAVIVQVVSHRVWERRVWSCYAALGSGTERLKESFVIPTPCRAATIGIANIGLPNAQVLFEFRPPRTMWLSHVLRTVEYDTFMIELTRRDGYVSAHIHHGSL